MSLVVEILTLSFFFASAAIGLFLAAFGDYLGYTTENQIYLFSIGVIATFFTIRPLLNRLGYNTDKQKTNKDNMMDKVGIVTRKVGGELNPGLVKLNGDVWKAITQGEEIKEDSRVKIIKIDSIILTVEEIKSINN